MGPDYICAVRSLVEEGVFGDGQLVDLQKEEQDLGVQLASSLGFVRLTLSRGGTEEVLCLVVKLPSPHFDSSVMFRNELRMYQEVIPALRVGEDMCPKFYYGSVSKESPERQILIFENLKYKGYSNSKHSPFLDFDHISLAMKRIAKFHSSSYIFKHTENTEKIEEMGRMLEVVVYYGSEFQSLHVNCMESAVDAFSSSNGPDEVLKELLVALQSPSKARIILTSPEEPFGVICHGDFCNNNVMYKYDQDGSPTDCILFDFQTSVYGSPAMDLAFYLYMHTTADSREKHWDQYLKIYWETLKENVPEHVKIPNHDEFLEHFATRAVYGFVICSFFLPRLLDPTFTFWDREQTLEEKKNVCTTLGGREIKQIIADIVSHLYERKYIQAFLDFVKRRKLTERSN